jgi:hypothetical protein
MWSGNGFKDGLPNSNPNPTQPVTKGYILKMLPGADVIIDLPKQPLRHLFIAFTFGKEDPLATRGVPPPTNQ